MAKKEHYGKWRFILDRTKERILIIFGLITLFTIIMSLGGDTKILGKWWQIVDPIIKILTLSVAIFVWYQQMREEWTNSYLPKRFSGLFIFEGVEVLRFENALLTNVGDIRALAQQIGSQMVSSLLTVPTTNLVQLKFVAPEVEVIGPGLNKKERFVHYSISFRLTELPQGVTKDKCLIWEVPFIGEAGQLKITEIVMSNRK